MKVQCTVKKKIMDDWDYDWDNLKQVKQKQVNPGLHHRQFLDKRNDGMYLKLISINFQTQMKHCKLLKNVILTGPEFPMSFISSCLMATCFNS